MQILLSHEDIIDVIQTHLQGAVEAHVRSQINLAPDQTVIVTISNNGGLFGATVGISKGTAKAAPAGPVKRAAKTTTPVAPAAPTTVELTEPTVEETASVDETPAETVTVKSAPTPLPITKAPSIFGSKPQAVPDTSDDPTAGLPDDVPEGMPTAAPEPVRKGIFSFAKGGAA